MSNVDKPALTLLNDIDNLQSQIESLEHQLVYKETQLQSLHSYYIYAYQGKLWQRYVKHVAERDHVSYDQAKRICKPMYKWFVTPLVFDDINI